MPEVTEITEVRCPICNASIRIECSEKGDVEDEEYEGGEYELYYGVCTNGHTIKMDIQATPPIKGK